MIDKLPPYSEEIERALLACMLESPADVTADFLSSSRNASQYFYVEHNRLVFQAIAGLVDAGRPVDLIVLHEALKAHENNTPGGWLGYLSRIQEGLTHAFNAPAYVDTLRKLYIKRQLVATGFKLQELGYDSSDADGNLEDAERAIMGISLENCSTDESTMKDLVLGTIDFIEGAVRNKGKLQGLATGFYDLDRKTSGLRPGQLIIVAARPGNGKTSLAMGITERVGAIDGVPVGVFSLEMTREELCNRMISSRARVPNDAIISGNLTTDEVARLSQAGALLAKSPIHICDQGGLTIAQLRAKARRMVQKYKIRLLVIDYLQLLRSSSRKENRNAEITEISNALKALGKELRLPVIALSQMSRGIEKDGNRQPLLSDLRDSGSVEQDADIVLFLHSDKAKQEQNGVLPVDLIIAKHRNGALGTIPLSFFKRITRFESATIQPVTEAT